ncbi:MAG: valine--tRNA ligase [Coriobacteriales bacterium]|jgi:valyl-tRNA synthetase|nr:valine--tRNA ligase [Coriobacteriales bacterium]
MDTSKQLDTHYDPKAIEGKWFNFWQDHGYFQRGSAGAQAAATPDAQPFTVVIPPPNVTGMLHMGHALNNTLQDILVRQARMQGRPTRWIVGTDHAGIATQNKVEQALAKQGKTRFDLGREDFVKACWEWRDDYGSIIINQLKTMGVSCDFSDEKFTMSDDYAKAIRRVFVDWYHHDLIYRGHRIINWCPRCGTALADDEVVHKEEKGHLWYLRYPLVEPVGDVSELIVATTRPETMLGDTGVAVNPADERYKELVQNHAMVKLPLTDRQIPVFADDYVDMAYGTGAVKVTPAHDPNDFAMGERAGLEQINIFDATAHLNENAGAPYQGLSREQARDKVVSDLDALGLLDHIEDISHAVGHCYRCDTIIEPWLSEQWFVDMQDLVKPAIAAVRQGEVVFNPKRWEKVYFNWLENIRDWCISRQLWWGHRIPVFYCDSCGWQDASEEDLTVCPECGAPLRQDEDVLDTWFSSQLWPFATQEWGSDDAKWAQNQAAYYPTNVLSTARDIIFLWVARMVISSEYFTGQIPFKDVIIHPTVLDKHGDIMSKSRGNGIDPVELIDKFGADGMRFGLALQVTGNQDIKFDENKLKSSRNFATKIYNAARFVLMNLEDFAEPSERITPDPRTDADKWILSELGELTRKIATGQPGYFFGAVARDLYSFFYNDFCDWYIEFSKAQLDDPALRRSTQANLVFVLDCALRFLHPFMPFITEELWQKLPNGDDTPSLMVAAWPDEERLAGLEFGHAQAAIAAVVNIITNIRSTRARYHLPPAQDLAVTVKSSEPETLREQEALIKRLAKISDIQFYSDLERPKESVVTVFGGLEVYIKLSGIVDLAAESARLAKKRAALQKDLDRLNKKLANQGFMAKAASEIIEETKQKAADAADEIANLTTQIDALA